MRVEPDQDDARITEAREKLAHGFQGEEDSEGASTPQKDLLAAIVSALFALALMALSAALPNPGGPHTAPGLLPFLTGASLMAMAAGLGVRALREGGARNLRGAFALGVGARTDFDPRRAWYLFGLIVLMVVLVDVLQFELRYPIGRFELRIESFECLSTPILALILRTFWRASVLRCLAVAAVTVLAFAAAFRYGFQIPLPGSG